MVSIEIAEMRVHSIGDDHTPTGVEAGTHDGGIARAVIFSAHQRLDHATGLVVGETAVVGNRVSILQSVTLGGTGKEDGDRHPKIGDGVLISAGAKILGNIRVGEGAKVGAGSVVLQDVPAHTTVAGVPAKVVGKPTTDSPALDMDHAIPESQW